MTHGRKYTKVYRVENQKKIGPYVSGPGPHRYDRIRCPGPHTILTKIRNDGGDVNEYYYAFHSIKQLKAWFSKKARRTMDHEYGFFISVYRVPNEFVYRGDKQVAFHFKSAKFLCDMDLNRI